MLSSVAFCIGNWQCCNPRNQQDAHDNKSFCFAALEKLVHRTTISCTRSQACTFLQKCFRYAGDDAQGGLAVAHGGQGRCSLCDADTSSHDPMWRDASHRRQTCWCRHLSYALLVPSTLQFFFVASCQLATLSMIGGLRTLVLRGPPDGPVPGKPKLWRG